MAHFYFHLHNGNGWTRDQEGQDFVDVRTAEHQAEREARALVGADIAAGLPVMLNSFIAVHDEGDTEVARVSFSQVARLA